MIDMRTEGRALVVAIGGDVDHHTADDIKTAIDSAYARVNAKDMVLDFSRVTFMDSSGIGMIIGRYKSVRQRGGALSVAGVNGDINRIFQLSGLPKIIQMFANVENALESAANKSMGGRRHETR